MVAHLEKGATCPKPGGQAAQLAAGGFIKRVPRPDLCDFEPDPFSPLFSKQTITKRCGPEMDQPRLLFECFVRNQSGSKYPGFRLRKKSDLTTEAGNGCR